MIKSSDKILSKSRPRFWKWHVQDSKKQFSGKATVGVNSCKIHYRHKNSGEHNGNTVRSTPNKLAEITEQLSLMVDI